MTRLPSPDAPLQAIADRLAVPAVRDGVTPGLVVGVRHQGHGHVFGYGETTPGSGTVPDADTLFEIGSITKVFTALLLADMIQRGEVKEDDPVRSYLPADVRLPPGGEAITLGHLATHTSGLPRVAAGFMEWAEATAGAVSNPHARYKPRDLYASLPKCTLSDAPGKSYSYSNVGGGLLGHVLERRTGLRYERLLIERIAEPLRLVDTRLRLTASRQARLAPGHDRQGRPVPNWDWDVLAGAGGLRSTVDDLLRFLAAETGETDSPLLSAMRDSQRERHAVPPRSSTASAGPRSVDRRTAGTVPTLNALQYLLSLLLGQGDPEQEEGSAAPPAGPTRRLARRLRRALTGAARSRRPAPVAPTEPAATRTRGDGPTAVALGWHLTPIEKGRVLGHNGGTGGYHSYLGFVEGTHSAVVVLTNSNFPGNHVADQIGLSLLEHLSAG